MVSNMLLLGLCLLSHQNPIAPWTVGPILEIKNLKCRKIKPLAENQTVNKQQSWTPNPVLSLPPYDAMS